jgi:hypothetical protein
VEKMLKRIAVIMLVVALSLAVAAPALAGGGPPPRDEDGNRVRVIVYVESQGLFYDSIRWWIDANGDGEQNEGDAFFSCPLLGKGSAFPPAL